MTKIEKVNEHKRFTAFETCKVKEEFERHFQRTKKLNVANS